MKKILFMVLSILTIGAIGFAGCEESKTRNAENSATDNNYNLVQNEQNSPDDCNDGDCKEEDKDDSSELLIGEPNKHMPRGLNGRTSSADGGTDENETPENPELPEPPQGKHHKHRKPHKGHRRSPEPCPIPTPTPEKTNNLKF